MFNYANPMAMLTWAANVYGGVRTIGLCHGVQHGQRQIARVLGLPQEEVDIVCAGINHQTWFIQVKHKGEDLPGSSWRRLSATRCTARRKRSASTCCGALATTDRVQRALSEYVPWYRKRPEEIRDWIDLSYWMHGETGGYLRFCTENRNWFETEFRSG